MSTEPTNKETVAAEYAEWIACKEWLKPAIAREMELRKRLAAFFVSAPTEGTNRTVTDIDGKKFAVILNHKLNRSIDETTIEATMQQLAERDPALCELGVLVRYKMELETKGYKALPAELRAIFEQALTITEGAPELELKEIVTDQENVPDNAGHNTDAQRYAALAKDTPATPISDAYHAAKRGGKSVSQQERMKGRAVRSEAIVTPAKPAAKKGIIPKQSTKAALNAKYGKVGKKPVAKPIARKAVSKASSKKRR